MKTGILTKITSCIICTAITMQVGLALTDERVNAAGYVIGAPNDDGSVNITLNSDDDGSNFYISNTSGDIIISISDTDQTYKFSEIGFLSINGGAYTYIDTNLEISAFHFDDGRQATLQIDYGYTLTIPENSPGTVFASVGKGNMFIVEGTLDIFKFRSSEFGNVGTVYINDGTVISDEIDISGMNIMSTTDSKLVPKDSFKIGSNSFYGTVVAQPDTEITVDGGSFNLQVKYSDGTTLEKEISGETDTKTAEEWLDDPNPVISTITGPIYVGTDYDFSNLVSVASGYDKSLVKLQYSKDQSTISESKPTAKGNGYYVRAVAPAYGSFRKAVSGWKSYDIDYIPLDTLMPDTPYCTTNIVNGHYVQGGFLVLTPPDGIEIGSTTIPDVSPASPFYLSHETIYEVVLNDSGEVNTDIGIYFTGVEGSDYPGATTDEISIKEVCPEIENLVFDYHDPEIILESVDGKDVGPVEEGEEYHTVACDYVTFGISDENIDKVYLNDELLEDGENIEDGTFHISLSSVAGEVTDYTIKATDLSGRESTYSISLYPPPGDPILTIEIPSDPIYVDDDYEITAGSRSDNEVSIEYYTADEEPLDEKPTEAGDYIVVASVEASDFYDAAEKTASFSILKRTPDLSVSVPKTYVNDTVSPVITGVPEDYSEELIIYEYKISKAADTAYSETVPKDAGDYTVRVTLPETRKYNKITDTAIFTISKHEITNAKVTVNNILFGETPSPSVTGAPTDYNGNITYIYKDSTGAVHEADETFAAGTYTVTATLSATAIYEEKTLETTFTVSKNPIDEESLTVEVENIFVGETPSPSVTGAPTDYDGKITYQYKLSTDEDSEYTTTAPKAAGVYTVLAILDPSDKYSGTSCTAAFTISKIEFDPTLTVSDIFVGDTVTPVLDGIPEDYNGEIKYQYKLATASNYSTTVPSAEGTYEVLVILEPTDKYLGSSCTDTFTISKIELDPSLTVSAIKVGQTPAPSVTGIPEDYDGEITFDYIDGNGDSCSADSLAAGNYLVRATIPGTDKYERAVCETDLEVSKNDLTDAKVAVDSIKVGQTPAPSVTGIPEDYDGEITFVYIDGNGDSCSADSLAAGNYLVRATIPETDKYERAVCEADLEVSKNDLTDAKVTVSAIKVGQTPAPSLTGIPEDYDGEITFVYIDGNGDSCSADSLTAGNYLVRATIPATDKYERAICETDLEVSKNDVTATVSVADIDVGGTVKPVLTVVPEDYDGKAVFEYKSSKDTAYSSTVPSAAGSYTVRVTLPETDVFYGTTCTDTFTIGKIEFEASVSVADILVGGTVNPVLSGVPEDYDGTITYQYKSGSDSSYSSTVPSAAGTYTVLVTLSETDKYVGTTCTASFVISKSELTASVSVSDIYVGETPKPVVTTDPKDYDGQITFEYKESSAADTAYSSAVPSKAGKYTVRAALSSTANYLGTSCEASFSIKKKEATASVYVADTFVGKTPNPVVTTNSDGKATFEYKPSGSADSAYTGTAPTAKGTYTCKATIPETDNYLGITCTCDFKIKLNPVQVMDLSVSDIFYGQTVSASFNTDSDGAVTIMYKPSGAADSAYSTSAPTKVGDYTAMATVAETSVFEGKSITTNFKISYLDAPGTAYIPSGTEGKNGYFISDVTLKAPAGFSISTTEGSGYSASVPYSESLSTIYLKRDDGALTAGISVSKQKIDKLAPSISSSASGSVLFVPSVSVSVSDKNLASVMVNGSPVSISGGSASVTLNRPESGAKTFRVTAEDEAGNVSSMEVTLMAEWLEDKIIPEGTPVSLVAGEAYFLDEGQWTVSIVNADGTITECATVFSGNIPFYVSVSGDYIFTRVT